MAQGGQKAAAVLSTTMPQLRCACGRWWGHGPQHTWKCDLVLCALLQQQLAVAVEQKHAERAVQQAARLRGQEAVAVVLVCAARDGVCLVHQDAVVLHHKVLLAAVR
jgi:hypothetical protein